MDHNRKNYKKLWHRNIGKANIRNRCLANSHIIDEFLKNSKCVECEESDPMVLLVEETNFDVNRSRTAAYSEKAVLGALNECVVRCYNHSAIRNGRINGWWWEDREGRGDRQKRTSSAK